MQTTKNKNNKQKGFTLIELMITVAIVGILAAVAMPAYQDYTVRAQISEGINMVSGAKTFVNDYYTNTGTFPADNVTVGYPGGTGKYITSVAISGGGVSSDISAVFGNDANVSIVGRRLNLTASTNASGNVQWDCWSPDIDDKYLPAICR